MKVFSKLFLLFFATGAFATQTVMIDPYGSPHAGSSNLIFLQELMIRGEDSFFSQPSQNSTLKICGRTLEQLLFWSNVNGIADVAQHEIFGHGYRLRELGYHNLGYSITPFSGSTRFLKEDYYRMTVRDSLAIAVAGLEAEQILARDLKTQWIAQGEMDGRLALLYFQAQQSIFFYTLITHLGGLEGNHGSGNDIQSYMYFNNHSHLNGHLTHKKLFHWTLFNWLDPMTFYSAYSFFHYIGKGTPWKFPMISFGDNLKYLPNVKIGYAPYAPEAYLENFFLYKGVPFYFYLKGGKRSMGLGFSCDRLLSGKRGSLGCKFDGWHHSPFNDPTTVRELEEETRTTFERARYTKWGGAAFSVIGRLNISPEVALFSELGGKTSGYLPGYRLGSDVFARIGLTFGKNGFQKKTITAEDKMSQQNSNSSDKTIDQ